MLAILSKFWSFITTGIMPKVLEWAGIGGAIIASLAYVRKTGADSVRNSEMKQTIKDLGVKDEINQDVNKLSDAELDKQLLEWKE